MCVCVGGEGRGGVGGRTINVTQYSSILSVTAAVVTCFCGWKRGVY